MQSSVLGFYFEDFAVGDEIYHSLSKTIFESDNNFFSLLTMNHHPVHITVPDISGKAIANLEYENVRHLNPVFLNDTIYVRSKILDKRVSKSKPDRGIVYVESIAYNQNGVDVLSFRRKVLVKRR